MSSDKLTGTTETCSATLPGCRDEARISWVSAEEAFRLCATVISEWHTIQSPPTRTGPLWRSRYVGLQVSQNPAEGGRQSDRQTEQSNGYGPGLKMLETPDISTLTGAASVAFRFHLCDSKSPRLYCCKVSVGVALVC